MVNALEILEGFNTIGLDEMDAVKLLDRLDFKFAFHQNYLPGIVEKLKTDYRVLSLNGRRFCRYDTRYFDTPDLKMYIQHHNGKLNRYKVRFREYVDSGIRFFEVKFKTNKERTIKDRILLDDREFIIRGESEKLLFEKTGYRADMLKESIQVGYSRITMVQNNLRERLTIDIGLRFNTGGMEKLFPELVIAEVKQDRASRSRFTSIMREYFIQEFAVSKYCLGIASLKHEVKINNIKPKLLYVKKLCDSNP